MKKLFLIDGAAGTGKSEFLNYVRERYSNSAKVIRKITTRKQRTDDKVEILDLDFATQKAFDARQGEGGLYYYYYGRMRSDGRVMASYGISKKDIDDSISFFEFTCVIVRNLEVINTLVKEYATIARVIRIFVYTDEDKVIQRMREKGADDASIQYRRDRIAETWNDFVEHPNPSRNTRILINNGSKQDYHRLINDLFVTYSDQNESREKLYISPNEIFPLLPPLIGHKKEINSVLEKNAYDKNVFLMMRFRDENDSLYGYISDLLKSKGFNCIRSNLPSVKKIDGVPNSVEFDSPKSSFFHSSNSNSIL
jgi:guanylate kinase